MVSGLKLGCNGDEYRHAFMHGYLKFESRNQGMKHQKAVVKEWQLVVTCIRLFDRGNVMVADVIEKGERSRFYGFVLFVVFDQVGQFGEFFPIAFRQETSHKKHDSQNT